LPCEIVPPARIPFTSVCFTALPASFPRPFASVNWVKHDTLPRAEVRRNLAGVRSLCFPSGPESTGARHPSLRIPASLWSPEHAIPGVPQRPTRRQDADSPFGEKGDRLFHSLRCPLERQDVILPQARIEQLPGYAHPSPVHAQELDRACLLTGARSWCPGYPRLGPPCARSRAPRPSQQAWPAGVWPGTLSRVPPTGYAGLSPQSRRQRGRRACARRLSGPPSARDHPET